MVYADYSEINLHIQEFESLFRLRKIIKSYASIWNQREKETFPVESTWIVI